MLQLLSAISPSFVAKKETWAMQKLLMKKELRKNGQVSKILKTMDTQMPAWKKEMNKIASVLSQKYFQVLRERDMFSRSKVELG
jgi:hypothetical protein